MKFTVNSDFNYKHGNLERDVVVVYQCSISNVMVTRDIKALFLWQGSRCVRMLETHPLLHRTYKIITSPCPGLRQIHHIMAFHIKMSLFYLLVGRCMESVLGVRVSARF